MKRIFVTAGLLVCTAFATWQMVSYAQAPNDRRDNDGRRPPRESNDHRPPPHDRKLRDIGPDERAEAELEFNLREQAHRNHDRMDTAKNAMDIARRAAEEVLRKMRENNAPEPAIRAAEGSLRNIVEQQRNFERMRTQAAGQSPNDSHSFSFSSSYPPEPRRPQPSIVPFAAGEAFEPVPMTPEELRRLQQFRKTVQNYRQEKDQGRKEKLRDEIRTQLADQMNRDVEKRREQIDALEKRLERLRKQVKAAEEGREESVNNLIDMLDKEEQPLGISPAWIDALKGTHIPSIDIEVRAGGEMRWNNRDDRPNSRGPESPKPPRSSVQPREESEDSGENRKSQKDIQAEIELDEDKDAKADGDDASYRLEEDAPVAVDVNI